MITNKIKVLMVVSSIGNGGAERVAVQLANYFAQNNLVVQICYRNVNDNEYATQDSVIINHVSSRFRVLAIAKIIREFKLDVLLSFTDVSNVIAYLAKLIARTNETCFLSIFTQIYCLPSRDLLFFKSNRGD